MLVCLHVPFDQQINSTNYLSLHYIIFVPYNLKAISSLRHRGNQTVLVKSVCKTAPKSLFWVPTCLPGFEYLPGWKNLKRISGSSLRPLRALNKDISAASKMLLNGVRLRYRQTPHRLLKMQEICLQFLCQPSLSAPSPTLQFYYTTTINDLPHPIILAAAACCTNTGSGAWSCGASGSIREKQKYSMWWKFERSPVLWVCEIQDAQHLIYMKKD